ncbi:MAG: NAD(P)/FAD-dependent oxidoreductase [Deltaproteobacteria bacterium]|nr:NAD(P)/FAD-dependent oxidoreductase [Deltaproteobacteria bacterium]
MGTSAWDLCVLGGGPAGFAAAMRAHDLGKRVVVVERGQIGGAGIHAGALSSKTMWHLSNDYAAATRTDRGYRAGSLEVSYTDVIAEVRTAVSERRALMERQLEFLHRAEDDRGDVELVRGSARFVGPRTVHVDLAEGGALTIEAKNFLIATGSKPRVPDGITVDGKIVVTSDQIEAFESFPKSMVIVGAGVIGCEYATIFANFGKTKIHIIDRQPRILPFEDEDVAEEVARSFESLGVVIHRASKLESLKVVDGEVEYVITNGEGKKETIRVEKALVSVGRIPNTKDLALDVAGVEIDKGCGIVVKDARTTVPHIYAAGDTTMDIALVNVAELEARFAVESMFDQGPKPINYEALSAIMFLRPEVASVGLNELKAREKGVRYRVGVVSNKLVGRNIAMRETQGFVKLLAEPESGKLLGLRVVGPEASSTIQGIAFLIDQNATLNDIDRCVHPHPAITEGVQECARMLLGRSVMKVDVFRREGLLRCGEG